MDGGTVTTPDPQAVQPATTVSATAVLDMNANLDKDPDELALEQARAAVAAEEGREPAPQDLDDVEANQPLQPEAPQQPDPNAQTPQNPMGRQQGKPKPGPIPYERFHEVNERARTLEQQLAYERGAYEARLAALQQGLSQPAQQTGQPQQQQAPSTPDDLIKAERAKAREAAAKWEQGEITAAQYEEIRGQVEDTIWNIRQENSRPAAAEAPQSIADEQLLAQHAQQLEAAHPYLEVMTEQDVNRLVDLAYAQAAVEGKPIGTGARETARLREIVSELSDFYGPKWHPQAQVRQPTQQTQQPGGQQQLSPQARARLAARQRAAQHPIDTRSVGNAGHTTEITAAQVARMSEEELMALPAAVRARFL